MNDYSWNVDYISHYGKGHDDNPPGRGSGRYPWGSKIIKKGKTVYRFSSNKETELRERNYVSVDHKDVDAYFYDAVNGHLGFSEYEKVYMMRMSAVSDIKVKSAEAVIKDVLDIVKDEELNKAYETLKDSGYLNATSSKKSTMQRQLDIDIARDQLGHGLQQILFLDEYGGTKVKAKSIGEALTNMFTHNLEKKAQAINEQKMEDVRNLFAKYRAEGYGAIVDPEDVVWYYKIPMIVLNPQVFSKPVASVVYNHVKTDYGEMPLNPEDWDNLHELLDKMVA